MNQAAVTLSGNLYTTRLPLPISIERRFAHPEHSMLRVGVFGMFQWKCTTCPAAYWLPVRSSVLNWTTRALATPRFRNNGTWLSFQNPSSLLQKEHFLLQRRDIVRLGDHPIERCGPQLNQVDGAKTLVLGEAANKPAGGSRSESVRYGREIVMFLLLLIVVLVLLFGGGGGYYGYRRWGTGGGIGIVGLVVIILLFFYLFGGMRM